MKPKGNANLSELKQLIGKPILGKSDIVHLMVLSRVVMEENRLQSTYPYLNLYCNWAVHPKLSQSLVCLQVLENLTDILLKYTDTMPHPGIDIYWRIETDANVSILGPFQPIDFGQVQ